jgi:hypothetical protein
LSRDAYDDGCHATGNRKGFIPKGEAQVPVCTGRHWQVPVQRGTFFATQINALESCPGSEKASCRLYREFSSPADWQNRCVPPIERATGPGLLLLMQRGVLQGQNGGFL